MDAGLGPRTDRRSRSGRGELDGLAGLGDVVANTQRPILAGTARFTRKGETIGSEAERNLTQAPGGQSCRRDAAAHVGINFELHNGDLL